MQKLKQTIKINSSLFSTQIALGTWAFGSEYWENQSVKDSKAVIREAIKLGINHFDTAIAYGNGRSEQITSQGLAKIEANIIIASKSVLKTNRSIKTDLINSLKRMNKKSLDIYYIHWPKTGIDPRYAVEILNECKSEGLIKAVGVSNFNVDQLELALKGGPIDILQTAHNLLWRNAEKEIIPFCRENKIKIATYSPLAQGILTGKFPKNPTEEVIGNRKLLMFFDPKIWKNIYPLLEELKKEANKQFPSIPLAALIIKWSSLQTFNPIVITGARTPKQLKETLLGMDIENNHCLFAFMDTLSIEFSKIIPKEDNIFRIKY